MGTMTQEHELTAQEVADRLGVNWLTVIRRIQSGKLRARKEGKEWRIRESDLEAYINSTFYQSDKHENSQDV
jgi:excisionase family DNA binding protein